MIQRLHGGPPTLPLLRSAMQRRHSRIIVAHLHPATAYGVAIDTMQGNQIKHQVS
jgi:hypothetical protein